MVSPRSIRSDSRALTITVSGPGQCFSVRLPASAGTSSARARISAGSPINTGGGMSRPRSLVSSSRCTASASNASAPIPYTVSVGSTMHSPFSIAVRAASAASASTAGSEPVMSNR